MDTSTADKSEVNPVVNEELWRAWVQKGRLHDQATARKRKLAGIALVVLAFCLGLYVLTVR